MTAERGDQGSAQKVAFGLDVIDTLRHTAFAVIRG